MFMKQSTTPEIWTALDEIRRAHPGPGVLPVRALHFAALSSISETEGKLKDAMEIGRELVLGHEAVAA